MSKHTPGPWESRGKGVFASGRRIGGFEVMGAAQKYGPSDKANARLAAAAPDLLKACKWFMQQLDDSVLVRDISRDGEPDWTMRMLRFTVSLSEGSEAIAKADGK